MSDKETLNASESGASTSPTSTTPSATTVPAPTPALSDDVVARIREQVAADLSAKFQADLEKVRSDALNQAKSMADKKRNEALRRANLLKEAEQDFVAEGVDAAVIGRVAKRMTDRIFYSDDPAPEPARPAPQPTPQPAHPTPAFDEDAWEVQVRREAKKQFGLSGPELLAFVENAKQIAGNDPQADSKWTALGRKQMLAMAEREKQEAIQAKKDAETAAMGKTLEGQPPLSPFPVGGQPPSGDYKAKPTLNDTGDLADAIVEKFFKNRK